MPISPLDRERNVPPDLPAGQNAPTTLSMASGANGGKEVEVGPPELPITAIGKWRSSWISLRSCCPLVEKAGPLLASGSGNGLLPYHLLPGVTAHWR